MSTVDGFVGATVKVVDHGPNGARYNIVIVGDGYRAADAGKYHADVRASSTRCAGPPRSRDLWCGINVHRVDVVSTDSGADDPASCGDLSVGSGAAPRTYFDSTFCGGGGIRRLLTCDGTSARDVAQAQVPEVHMTMVIVNSPLYGGSGGTVATFSTACRARPKSRCTKWGTRRSAWPTSTSTYAGCASGETDHSNYVGGEPVEPNVTLNANRNTIKWKAALTSPADALPTTSNANCAQCDTQANPKPAGYVGAYTGARYYHCGCFRPTYDCRMRTLGKPFCAVCQKIIRDTLRPYLPAAFQGLWWAAPAGSESGWGINFAHQGDTIFATWFTYDAGGRAWWLSMTAAQTAWNVYAGTLFETHGPPFNAMPFNPALVTKNAVGTGTLTFTDANNASFAFSVNGVSRTKAITRQAFGPLPTCTFGAQQALSARDQLPGPVVGGAGRRRIRMGDQFHAPGQHDLRHLVHLPLRRLAAVAVGHRQQHGAGRIRRNPLPDERARLRCGAVPSGERRADARRHGDADVRQRQQRDVFVHDHARHATGRRHADEADHAADIPGARHRLPVIRKPPFARRNPGCLTIVKAAGASLCNTFQ